MTESDTGPAPVIVVATIRPLPEHRDAVLAALRESVPVVHGEPGCSLYALHEAPDRLVMIEQWDSPAAFEVHGKGDALRALGAKLKGRLSEPFDVVLLGAIPLGDADRGALRG
jgi:quinol monooxygenase YgiN